MDVSDAYVFEFRGDDSGAVELGAGTEDFGYAGELSWGSGMDGREDELMGYRSVLRSLHQVCSACL